MPETHQKRILTTPSSSNMPPSSTLRGLIALPLHWSTNKKSWNMTVGQASSTATRIQSSLREMTPYSKTTSTSTWEFRARRPPSSLEENTAAWITTCRTTTLAVAANSHRAVRRRGSNSSRMDRVMSSLRLTSATA